MSKTLKLLRKAAEKREDLAARGEPDFQSLEVSDIRKKLFEKIKERQASSAKPGPIDISAISKRAEAIEPPKAEPAETITKKLRDEYSDKIACLEAESKKLAKLLEEKDGLIAELKSRPAEDPAEQKKEREKTAANVESLRSKLYAATKELKEKSERLSQLEDMLKNRDKRLADNDKHFTKIGSEKDALAEKLASAENTIMESADKLARLESEIASKDKELDQADRNYSKNIEMAKKELMLKMEALNRENRSLEGKISQLNIEIEAKNKRLVESESSHKELEESLKEAVLKVELEQGDKKDFEKKISKLEGELTAIVEKLAESDKACKDLEIAKKELVLQVKSHEREKRTLEGKISQLAVEIEAKDKRLDESEKAYKGLDDLIKDAALKLEASESKTRDLEEKIVQVNKEIERNEDARRADRTAYEENISKFKTEIEGLNAAIMEKEKTENEFKDTLSRLESEIEARDKKIQTDIKYCEGIVKEVNDLRQKMKALRLKIR